MKFHCFTTHFTSISCRSETTRGGGGGGGKSIHFLKALFKTNLEINVSRLYPWATYNIWHERLLIHHTRDKASTQLR